MKLIIATGLLLVIVSVAAQGAIPFKPKPKPKPKPWNRRLKPYPKPEPWARDPLYLEAVNNGKFNKQLTADVSFARDTIVNFGLNSGRLNGQVLQVSRPNVRNAYSTVESLNLVRSGCPPHFISMFLRKVNQLRQRHQAAPLKLNNSLTDWTNQVILAKDTSKDAFFNKEGFAILRFNVRRNTSDINVIRQNVEDIVEHFYMPGLKMWRMYGKQASVSDLKLVQVRNFLTLLNGQSKGMGFFCQVVQRGLNNPVTKVDNQVKINFILDNFNGKTVSRNVFPPGYFNWDKKVIGTGGDKKKLVNKQKFDE